MQHDPFIGQIVDRKYNVTKLLGKGGMGAVYLAEELSPDGEKLRIIALKLLLGDFAKHPDFIRRFEREIKVAIRMQHVHILPVYGYGTFQNSPYIAMRYLEGGSLSDYLKEMGQLTLSEAIKILKQIGQALDYAHQEGIIHRDLKPDNIMFDRQQNAYLTDFGIAKPMESQNTISIAGAVIGTPHYMSPEQWSGMNITALADVYALGIMTYQLLTGELPFHAPTTQAIMHRHLNDNPIPPNILNGGLNENVSAVILRAIAKDPMQRYGSAGQFVTALEQATRNFMPSQHTHEPMVPRGTILEGQNPNETIPTGNFTPPPRMGTKPPTRPPTHPSQPLPPISGVSQPTRVPTVVVVGILVIIALLIGLLYMVASGGSNDSTSVADNPAQAATLTETARPPSATSEPNTATLTPAITETATSTASLTATNTLEPTITLTPSRTPFGNSSAPVATEVAASGEVTVTRSGGSRVSVRLQPESEGDLIGDLGINRPYPVIGTLDGGDYFLVDFEGVAAWVENTEEISFSGNTDSLPVVTLSEEVIFITPLNQNGTVNRTTKLYDNPPTLNGTRSPIAELNIGDRVVIFGELNSWSQVQLADGTQGWIGNIAVHTIENPNGVVNRDLKVFDNPPALSDNRTQIAELATNEAVLIVGELDDWYQIQLADGTIGWVAKLWVELTEKTTAPTASVTLARAGGSRVSVRQFPERDSYQLGELEADTQYTVLGISENRRYLLIDYDIQAWVVNTSVVEITGDLESLPVVTPSDQLIFSNPINQTGTAKRGLKVYDNPPALTDNRTQIAEIAVNETILVIGALANWYQVQLADGTVGWVGKVGVELVDGSTAPAEIEGTPAYIRRQASMYEKGDNSVDNEVIASLPTNTSVTIIGARDVWYQVRLADGREGWVVKSQVIKEEPESSEPVPSANVDNSPSDREEVSLVLGGEAELKLSDDFEGNRLGSFWSVWKNRPMLENGIMTIEGLNTYDNGVVYSLASANAVLILFQSETTDTGNNYSFALERGTWHTDSWHQVWFSGGSSRASIARNFGAKADQFRELQNFRVDEGKWYYLLIWTPKDQQVFYIQVWEKDNPNEFITNRSFELSFAPNPTKLIFNAESGNLHVDYVEQLRLPDDYELPTAPPTSANTDSSQTDAPTVVYSISPEATVYEDVLGTVVRRLTPAGEHSFIVMMDRNGNLFEVDGGANITLVSVRLETGTQLYYVNREDIIETEGENPSSSGSSNEDTALPEGVLLTDDFEDNNLAGWNFLGVNEATIVSQEDNRVLRLGGTEDWVNFSLRTGQNWTDYAFEARVQIIEYTSGEFPDFFMDARRIEGGSYAVYISAKDDYVGIGGNLDGEWRGVLGGAASNLTLGKDQWYTLKVVVKGNRIEWYVNGGLVAWTTDEAISKGNISFTTPPDAEVYIDNVIVIDLSE